MDQAVLLGDPDETVGWNHLPIGKDPARQRFGAPYDARTNIKLGLVMRHQGMAGDRQAQVIDRKRDL